MNKACGKLRLDIIQRFLSISLSCWSQNFSS